MKSMYSIAFAVLFLLLDTARAEPTIDSSKATFYVGKEAMVCGIVYEIKNFKKGTYLNVGGAFPDQHIALLVWATDEPKFRDRFGNFGALKDARVCARGLIESYKNSLQIKVSNPQFIRLMK